MFYQAFVLLKKLKKAQQELDREIFIDYEKNTVSTVHDGTQSFVTVDLQKFGAPRSVLDYLEKEGYINKKPYGDYFSVTSYGWYYFQITFNKFCAFMFHSVVVPIFVSIITTVIALYLN